MKRLILLTTLVALAGVVAAGFAHPGEWPVVVPVAAADKAVPNDKKKLQGHWNIVKVEIDKKPLSMDPLKDSMLFVKGERYSFELGKTKLEFTFKLFPDRTPKAIDLTVFEGSEKGKTYFGIYKLEGDTFTICRTTEPGKPRPTAFVTEPDSGRMIVVWKHMKH